MKTLIYSDKYSDLIYYRKKCYLFTSWISKTDISKRITKVELVNKTSRISISSVAVNSFIGSILAGPWGMFLGAALSKSKETNFFIVHLEKAESFLVETDDEPLSNYLMGFLC